MVSDNPTVLGLAQGDQPQVKKRSKSTDTHCAYGHEWSADNTYITPKGRRQCRACKTSHLEVWRNANPDRVKFHSLTKHAKRRYRITVAERESIVEEQNNRCAICQSRFGTEFHNRPCIDHDHSCCPSDKTCGKCVRGALCDRCNNGIARFDDNIQILQRAIEYLQVNRISKEN